MTQTTKLSAKERQNLRWALRAHPQILSQVKSLSEISTLDKKSLLEAAETLGVDVEAIKAGARPHERPEWQSSEAQELMMRRPAFVGSVEEPLTFVLAGTSVTRMLRVSYDMTPEWPYFDPELGQDTLGWEQSSLTYELLVRRETGLLQANGKVGARQRKGKEEWVNCTELFMHDLLGADFDDVIDDRIEEACLRENEARKKAFQSEGSSEPT